MNKYFFLQTINYSNMHNEPDLCHNKNSTFCGLNIFAFSWKMICAFVRERNVKEYSGKKYSCNYQYFCQYYKKDVKAYNEN